MTKNIFALLLGLLCSPAGKGQELYVFTEPASNMAAHSLALRLNNTLYRMEGQGTYAYRVEPELMWGVNKNWMVHAAAFASDVYQNRFKAEGGSLYAKYRFYSSDEVHRHFRMAAFVKGAFVDQPDPLTTTTGGVSHAYNSDEIDLNGNNSGFGAGIVGTQLLHKVALSGTAAYFQRVDNGVGFHGVPGQSLRAMDYSLSAGMLLLPRHYNNYGQTNVNLMCEFLGSEALDKNAGFLDIAPALQCIFNSISRLDVGYRTQLTGTMARLSRNAFFVRLEYNFLNAYR